MVELSLTVVGLAFVGRPACINSHLLNHVIHVDILKGSIVAGAILRVNSGCFGLFQDLVALARLWIPVLTPLATDCNVV